jgi:hypothetical protein
MSELIQDLVCTGEEVLSMFVILAGKCPFTEGDYKTEKRT